MKKPLFLLITSLFLALVFTNCGKDSEFDYFNSESKVKKVLDESHTTIAEYTYNQKGQLKSMWEKPFFTSADDKAEFEFVYDTNDMLIEQNGFMPGNPIMSSFQGAMGKDVSMKYIYNKEGKLSKVTTSYSYDDDKLNFLHEIHYAYLSDSIFEIRSYYSYLNDTTGYYRIEFHVDKKGNIFDIKQFSKEKAKLERMYYFEKYTFDDQINPFRTTFIPENRSVNNILTKKAFYFGPEGVPSNINPSVFAYEYEYNSNGYPTKQTLTNPNKTVQIKYFVY